MDYNEQSKEASTGAGAASLIPDGCNTGVVFRTLFAVNAAALLALWLAAPDCTILVQNFLDLAMLIEWGTLLSLAALCGARRLLAGRAAPPVVQRALCAFVPALLAALLAHGLGLLDDVAPPRLALLKAAAAAALGGLALQTYFELRVRAFSPVAAEARLQALQARIRPHFLFNTLNAVLALIRAEPRRAERTLEDLADLFRVAMQDARQPTSLRQEIDLCERYLAIEQVRLGERLQVAWDIAQAVQPLLGRVRVPALILQPLLENAVHHGVEPAAGPSRIGIVLARQGDKLVFTITNPLHDGARAEGGHQMALANIRERLALLYDVEAELAAGAQDGRYEVRLQFPLTTREAA